MQCKKMFKMDFSFSFSLPCMLMILTIISGKSCVANNLTSQNNISEIQVSQYDQSGKGDTNCVHPCDKVICLKDDERKCLGNETSFLCVCDLLPAVHIRCLANGKISLSCETGGQFNDNVHWTLNGNPVSDACITDNGTKIILEKGKRGKYVCQRGNHCKSSPVEMTCENGDLLQHPFFLYVLIACGGGAVLLAVTASLITCCCMKTKHNFVRVPVEDEKDEGITMSAISSERPNPPPNGDHCEVTNVLVDSTPNTSAQICETFKPDLKEDPNPSVGPEVKSECRTEEKVGTETEFQEDTIDNAAQEIIDDCFPDPIDA
ncbi:hypothetical protein E2320_005215 [Naja naja]|nr:hypothetical protein E2320_005215 [Naja naja]